MGGVLEIAIDSANGFVTDTEVGNVDPAGDNTIRVTLMAKHLLRDKNIKAEFLSFALIFYFAN